MGREVAADLRAAFLLKEAGYDGSAARAVLAGLAEQSRSGHELARKVLGDHHLLGEALAGRDDFIGRTGQYIDIIRSAGPLAAIAEASTTSERPHATIRSTP